MLHHVVQTAPGAAPTRWMCLLHGILGTGPNLRTVARRLCAARPDWGFLLPDLRHHGDSHDVDGDDTIAGCVADLDTLAAAVGVEVRTAIGHSFGGKVALAWGATHEARGVPVDAVWALDVPPGRPELPLALQSEVVAVVAALRELPMPLPRRESVVELLAARGFSAMLGQWMTTNLRHGDGGFVWRFDLDGVERLLRDYAVTDLWPWLASPDRRAEVHVVRAGRSDRWSDAELARFTGPRLHLHTMERAGHWVHVDDPDALHALLLQA